MFEVTLYQPEIPPNTGNIIRLCANTGCGLHLIGPLGFSLDEPRLRRAGLDYHEYAEIKEYQSLEGFYADTTANRVLAFSTRGRQAYSEINYQAGDFLLFGPETCGLPAELLDALPENRVGRLPMRPDSRSLNLSNTVAVVVYEAWRQLGFAGGR